jgi:hypothetical protein
VESLETFFTHLPVAVPLPNLPQHAGSCSEQSELTWQSTATHYGFTLDHFTRFCGVTLALQELLLNNDSSIIWIFFQFSIISLTA